MSIAPVIIRVEGRAGRLTLNRPEALHALNAEMCKLMTKALLVWSSDPAIEFILIDHAAGTRGFCAGGDVRMLSDSGAKDGIEGAAFFATEYRLNTLIHEYQKPCVAIIDGITMGGGVGISVHGSHRIATERTTFAMPESGIGLLPDVGGGYFLPRLSGQLGRWLALTGARLKGEDVLAVGVATHLALSDDLPELVNALCDQGLSALSSVQTQATGSFVSHRAEMDALFSKDTVEDIVSALNMGSDWAQLQAKMMESKSPLTMKLAHRQLREGAEAEFREVMRMEYRITSRLIQTQNFQEGIRAVLIDRDNNPAWIPASLQDVSLELVGEYFASLGDGDLSFVEIT